MNAKTERTAKRFNIYDRILKLEKELLNVEGTLSVRFCLDGFEDSLNEVIFLVRYEVPVTIGGWYIRRNQLKNDIVSVALNYGLVRTEDAIEDYGDHYFFFVMNCKEWCTQ